MPRPEADYVPQIVRAAAAKVGTIPEFSRSLKHSGNWIYDLFKGEQPRLQPYAKLADYLGVTLHELTEIIEEKRVATYIEEAKRGESTAWLARKAGVSATFLKGLHKNSGELNGLNSYVELARACGCKVDDLRTGSPIQRLSA